MLTIKLKCRFRLFYTERTIVFYYILNYTQPGVRGHSINSAHRIPIQPLQSDPGMLLPDYSATSFQPLRTPLQSLHRSGHEVAAAATTTTATAAAESSSQSKSRSKFEAQGGGGCVGLQIGRWWRRSCAERPETVRSCVWRTKPCHRGQFQ